MMKYIAPVLLLIALIQFTTPNGNAVFVNPEQVIAVAKVNDECPPSANVRLITTRGDTCLKETQDQVVEQILLWGPSK